MGHLILKLLINVFLCVPVCCYHLKYTLLVILFDLFDRSFCCNVYFENSLIQNNQSCQLRTNSVIFPANKRRCTFIWAIIPTGSGLIWDRSEGAVKGYGIVFMMIINAEMRKRPTEFDPNIFDPRAQPEDLSCVSTSP